MRSGRRYRPRRKAAASDEGSDNESYVKFVRRLLLACLARALVGGHRVRLASGCGCGSRRWSLRNSNPANVGAAGCVQLGRTLAGHRLLCASFRPGLDLRVPRLALTSAGQRRPLEALRRRVPVPRPRGNPLWPRYRPSVAGFPPRVPRPPSPLCDVVSLGLLRLKSRCVEVDVVR